MGLPSSSALAPSFVPPLLARATALSSFVLLSYLPARRPVGLAGVGAGGIVFAHHGLELPAQVLDQVAHAALDIRDGAPYVRFSAQDDTGTRGDDTGDSRNAELSQRFLCRLLSIGVHHRGPLLLTWHRPRMSRLRTAPSNGPAFTTPLVRSLP